MRLLLDTHIFLWVVLGSSALKSTARRMIEAADEVYVSAVSIWKLPSRQASARSKPTLTYWWPNSHERVFANYP